MKKRDNKAQKFLSCLDAIILSKNEKRRGETNSCHRDILRIELAELKGIRSLFISIFKIKPQEPPVQQKTNSTSKDNALSNNKPNKLPLIEEKLSEGTNKLERKIDLKTNKKVKTIYTNAKMESRKDIRILVVDDEESPRLVVSEFLKNDGYNVMTTNNADEAIEIISKNFFDVVITEIRMRGKNGIELLREVKTISPNTSVIFLTTYVSMEVAKEAVKYRASDYLVKPFEADVLRDSVREAVNRSLLLRRGLS